ncbi:hypothetical protein BS17DRAFT_878794 [Gyrodon lividus]|nr:hypothetical protein BS17DRAFT_878794 [Gyrodon lividus]
MSKKAKESQQLTPLPPSAASISRKALTIRVSGQIIHPLNLRIESVSLLPHTSRPAHSTETWDVSVAELSSIVDSLWELTELNQAGNSVPKCGSASEGFPYKQRDGSQAFLAQVPTKHLAESSGLGSADGNLQCPVCEKTIKHKALRSHMGGHILRAQMGASDENIKVPVSDVDLCGFCGQASHPVRLTKEGRKRTFQPSSSCPFTVAFSLGAAANSTKTSPLTNIPIRCTLCPPSSGDRSVFWKYNMPHHINTAHSSRDGNKPLPSELSAALKISQSEQRALGIPHHLITPVSEDESDLYPQTSAATCGKHKRTATTARNAAAGECSKRLKG